MLTQPGQPTYRALADKLRRKIENGDIQTGSALPSTSELMARYEVSSTVVKNAMSLLRASGHVVGRQGKGVYAALPAGPEWLGPLLDAGEQLAKVAGDVTSDAAKLAVRRWEDAAKAVPNDQLRRAAD
jgi:DNA-binding FadR family transcriptional regulator